MVEAITWMWVGKSDALNYLDDKPINLMAKGCNKPGASTKTGFENFTSTLTFLSLLPWRANRKLNREELDWTWRLQCAGGENPCFAGRRPSFPHRVRTHDAVEAEKEFQKTSWLVPSHAQMVVMTECRDMVLSYSDDQLH